MPTNAGEGSGIRTSVNLNTVAFREWMAANNLTRYRLEYKADADASIPSNYFYRWARGHRITLKLQRRLLEKVGVPETIFIRRPELAGCSGGGGSFA